MRHQHTIVVTYLSRIRGRSQRAYRRKKRGWVAVKMMEDSQKRNRFRAISLDFFPSRTNEHGQYRSITSRIRSSGANKRGRDDRIRRNLKLNRSSNASSSSLSRNMNLGKGQRESLQDIPRKRHLKDQNVLKC